MYKNQDPLRALKEGVHNQRFMPPAPKKNIRGGTRNPKSRPPPTSWQVVGAPPPLCRESGVGDFLKYPKAAKMGQLLGHFCIYEGSKSQNFSRATRARAYIHGYITYIYNTAPLQGHKNAYMQKNGRFGGYFGISPENLTRNRIFFGGGAPPPFRRTPYKTLTTYHDFLLKHTHTHSR